MRIALQVSYSLHMKEPVLSIPLDYKDVFSMATLGGAKGKVQVLHIRNDNYHVKYVYIIIYPIIFNLIVCILTMFSASDWWQGR